MLKNEIPHDYFSNGFVFQHLILQKTKVGVKITQWLVCSRKTIESKAPIPKVMKPTHKIEEKRDERLRD